MKMKEQRLNIKMAKKEYMISCMAEQVGLREYGEPADLRDSMNFLSTQQIAEILQESEVPTERRSFKRVSTHMHNASDQVPPTLISW